jgi:uncharacterized membrane protein YkoI
VNRTTSLLLAGGIAAAAAAAGTGIAIAVAQGPATDDDGSDGRTDYDVPIEGADLDRASSAALEHTGGGRVTETETGDEESYYEVEVTLDDGTQVDVQLDADFRVVGEERDGPEGPGDD